MPALPNNMLLSILTGLFIGAIQVGMQTYRTLSVYDGRVIHTLGASGVLSVGYFVSIAFIINRDVPGYIGFSLGAAAVTGWMAWKNRHKHITEANNEQKTSR